MQDSEVLNDRNTPKQKVQFQTPTKKQTDIKRMKTSPYTDGFKTDMTKTVFSGFRKQPTLKES